MVLKLADLQYSGAAKGVKLKPTGKFELNQKTLCASRLSKWQICNKSKVIKLKPSGNVERDVEVNHVYANWGKGASTVYQERQEVLRWYFLRMLREIVSNDGGFSEDVTLLIK
jgi:hypothetical protein